MSIELTSQELSELRKKQKMEDALQEWKNRMSKDFSDKQISKRNIKNKKKVKSIKKQAEINAKTVISNFDKGFIF